MKITVNQLRKIIKEEVKNLTESRPGIKPEMEEKFKVLKDEILASLVNNGEIGDPHFINDREIMMYLYDPDAPDQKSQHRVSITLELYPPVEDIWTQFNTKFFLSFMCKTRRDDDRIGTWNPVILFPSEKTPNIPGLF